MREESFMATALDKLELTITGRTAEAIERFQQITGEDEPRDVIFAALRVYEWVLVHQAHGKHIFVGTQNGTVELERELTDYVKDKALASDLFKHYEIQEHGMSSE
jgi:hypothetical protein